MRWRSDPGTITPEMIATAETATRLDPNPSYARPADFSDRAAFPNAAWRPGIQRGTAAAVPTTA